MRPNLIVFPQTMINDTTVEGVSDAGETVLVSLDVSHYHGDGFPPNLPDLVSGNKGQANLRIDNGPELYREKPLHASALLFNRVNKTGLNTYTAGWASVLSPGVPENISADMEQLHLKDKAPYEIQLGHLHYQCGQSVFYEGLGFIETPYLVAQHVHKPKEQWPDHAVAVLNAFDQYLDSLKEHFNYYSEGQSAQALVQSSEVNAKWIGMLQQAVAHKVVHPKIRTYRYQNAQVYDASEIRAGNFFNKVVNELTNDGRYGGVYFRLKNIDENSVLPSHSAFLMNSYDPETQQPKDPALQFKSFVKYLGGDLLFNSVLKNPKLQIEMIPVQDTAIAPRVARQFCKASVIEQEVHKNHMNIPVPGYNAGLSVYAFGNVRVSKDSVMAKKPQPLSPAIANIAEVMVGPLSPYPNEINSIVDATNVVNTALNASTERIKNDPSVPSVNRTEKAEQKVVNVPRP